MNYDEQPLKLTDLDYLTGDHHLQMMKAALPYMNVPQQRIFSTVIKIRELQRTINLFRMNRWQPRESAPGNGTPKTGPAQARRRCWTPSSPTATPTNRN